MRLIPIPEAHRSILGCSPEGVDFQRYRLAIVSFPPNTDEFQLGGIEGLNGELLVTFNIHPVCSGPAIQPQPSSMLLLLRAGNEPVRFVIKEVQGPLCIAP